MHIRYLASPTPVHRKPSFLKAVVMNIQTQNVMERNNSRVGSGLGGCVKLCLAVSYTNKTFNPEEIFGLATSDANLSISNKIL